MIHLTFEPTNAISTIFLVETFEYGVKQAFERHFGPTAKVERILRPGPLVMVSLPDPTGSAKEVDLAMKRIKDLSNRVGQEYTSILGIFQQTLLKKASLGQLPLK